VLLLLLLLRKQLAVVISLFFFSLETVSILIGVNIYTRMYGVLSVQDYFQREPTGQGSAAQTFDGKHMSAGLRIPIIC
jgi:hypothetical protein